MMPILSRQALTSASKSFGISPLCKSTPSSPETYKVSPTRIPGLNGMASFPFSPGILVGDTLYVSGELGVDLHSGEIPKDFDAEVKACLDNIGIILKAAGMDYPDVVSAQVFLTDMTEFKRMNAVYASVFKMPRPARVTVGVTALAVPSAH